jgi:ABC-type polysaccharide/polyol phosphate export permease
MYHRNVKIIDIYISRLLLEVLGATASFILLSLFFISIGWMKGPENLLTVFVAWCMLSWFGFSLALVLGALGEESEVVEKIWHPASYLLFPLSGAAFLVDVLPPAVQKIVLLLPMVHGVEMLRDGYFGSSIRTHYSMQYMAIFCVVLTIFGFALERKISRKVMPE